MKTSHEILDAWWQKAKWDLEEELMLAVRNMKAENAGLMERLKALEAENVRLKARLEK